jgi:hypothetical protein
MHVGVLDHQTLGGGGGVEVLVGRDESDAAHPGGQPSAVQLQGGGQLHGVISPELVGICQTHGVGQERSGDLKGKVFLSQVEPETSQESCRFRRGDGAGPAAAGDGGADLDGNDAGQLDQISGTGMSQSLNPARAGLLDVAFDDGAAVEAIDGHLSGARG